MENHTYKKLYRSTHNKVLTGLIGGIGEHFGTDPAILRIAAVLIILVTGVIPGVIVYFLASLFMPEEPAVAQQTPPQQPQEPAAPSEPEQPQA